MTWASKYRAGLLLFAIVMLSICNVVIALGFRFFLGSLKPLAEPSAFLVDFRYLVAALAVVWLVAGVSAFRFFKGALPYLHFLVLMQLVVTGYAWYSTLLFQAK